MQASQVTVAKLVEATTSFFALHWSSSHGPPPQWDCWEDFLFGPVPNYLYGGCYALFVDHELAYIGLGASRGGGRYEDRGISRRIMSHIIRSDRTRGAGWSKLADNWKDATSLYTIGFKEATYLAAALETYLIRELSPPRNSRV